MVVGQLQAAAGTEGFAAFAQLENQNSLVAQTNEEECLLVSELQLLTHCILMSWPRICDLVSERAAVQRAQQHHACCGWWC